ncbi:MAG: hypothetical protein ACSHX0_04695 [Akkermansiaceae bacterium]
MTPKVDPFNSSHTSDSADNAEELVTREDGTQVIRVKKRKRRSKQPSKKPKQKSNPVILWTNILLSTALLIVPALGTIYIITKYNGGSFKELSEKNIAQVTNADKAQLKALKVSPISAKANSINLSWSQDGFFNKALLKNLRASIDLSSFVRKTWVGEEIVASEGHIYLRTPQSSTGNVASSSHENIYDFATVRCENLSVHFGDQKGSPLIKNIKATLRKTDATYKTILQGGELVSKRWPALKISSSIITKSISGQKLSSIIEADKNSGEITVRGNLQKNVDQPLNLGISVDNFPIEELLGADLGRMISGNISCDEGSIEYQYNKSAKNALEVVIPFKSSELIMDQLPMFRLLSEYTVNTQYVEPTFNHCTGILIRTLDQINIRDINFISNNLITITGNIEILADDSMQGLLDIKLPKYVFPASVPSFLESTEDGFYRCQVIIGGNIHSPHDNFKEQFSASSSRKNTIPEKKISPLEEFNSLTR